VFWVFFEGWGVRAYIFFYMPWLQINKCEIGANTWTECCPA